MARRQSEKQGRAHLQNLSETIEATKARCSTLYGFIKEAWHVLEPMQPFIGGWHLEAVCEHLEALSKGTLGCQHLALNIPPGSMKSLVMVFFAAWEWGPLGKHHLSYLAASYEGSLAERDNRKTRRLIESQWYQDRWPMPLVKAGDILFENCYGGWRWARAFNSLTGGRANRVQIDDPHSTQMAESDLRRMETITTFRESISDRLNNQAVDSIILTMQRLHTDDVTGVIRRLKLDYDILMIPMEFEPKRRIHTSIGWTDPRQRLGDLMCPERWSRKEVEALKLVKGKYAWAGQYQQDPTVRGGGLFLEEWFPVARRVTRAHPATRWVRGWDLAATDLSALDTVNPRTAGVLIGRQPDGSFVIGHAVAKGFDEKKAEMLITETARMDGIGVWIDLPQDPGQAGKVQKRSFINKLAGYVVFSSPESGDKVTRALPFAIQCENGNVWMIEGPWNEELIKEYCDFPGGSRKDLVDASSRAFARLIPTKGDAARNQKAAGPQVFQRERVLEGYDG